MELKLNLNDIILGVITFSLTLNGWFLRQLWNQMSEDAKSNKKFREVQIRTNAEVHTALEFLVKDYNERRS
jgi:hypothetical protein